MSENNPNTPSHTNMPWNTPWLTDELESVPTCPVCGSGERTVLHKDLIDNVFFVAPGKWTLHSCTQCKSAYLDPRPNPASIGKAYGSYYTHAAGTPRDNETQLTGFRRLRRMLANGYLNRRYGTQRQLASTLGKWMANFFPRQRQVLDAEFRYLPHPTQGQRLLDIGCGNGDFLVTAREAGWLVSGLEPDPKAADAAQQRGLDVTVGTVDLLVGESSCFDVITLSHVIEHVHEPKLLLEAVHRLLKPGGIVYIDTPNINSYGADIFQSNWRGLETPRHLVLFNPASLTGLLNITGFTGCNIKRRTKIQQGMHRTSLRMVAGYSPYGTEDIKLDWVQRAHSFLTFTKINKLEFITLIANKVKK